VLRELRPLSHCGTNKKIMKTIGLIGGLGWPSSAQYYELINRSVQAALGASHSAKILMYSFDFHEIELLQHQARWADAARSMIDVANVLKQGGADFLVICSNTMHRLAEDVEAAVDIPLVHVADVTGNAVSQSGVTSVGLLGTLFTMEEQFYIKRLSRHNLAVVIPDQQDRIELHRIIYEELVRGVVNDTSRVLLVAMIEKLAQKGVGGVILGCTEIMLLTQDYHGPIPLFDSTVLHAQAAVAQAIA
jgi:aspartate racemase